MRREGEPEEGEPVDKSPGRVSEPPPATGGATGGERQLEGCLTGPGTERAGTKVDGIPHVYPYGPWKPPTCLCGQMRKPRPRKMETCPRPPNESQQSWDRASATDSRNRTPGGGAEPSQCTCWAGEAVTSGGRCRLFISQSGRPP